MSALHTSDSASPQPGREGEQLACRIVDAIADIEGVPPEKLEPPLYHTIDPTALERLFEGPSVVSIRFEYGEYTVTARNDGTVAVDRREADEHTDHRGGSPPE